MRMNENNFVVLKIKFREFFQIVKKEMLNKFNLVTIQMKDLKNMKSGDKVTTIQREIGTKFEIGQPVIESI